jgi:Tol biopolymer transport system component
VEAALLSKCGLKKLRPAKRRKYDWITIAEQRMTPERWRQIEDLYNLARDHGDGVLANADSDLREEVEALLAQNSTGMLDKDALSLPRDSTETQAGIGSQLGPYKIEALLGQGGMGQVFRAIDTRLGREVAIKVSQERFTDRFEREARAIAALNHPNICTLHDVGPNYLVMELVEGETLAARLRRGKLPMEQTIRYGAQIASALFAAHAKGVIHRDLKPVNVMVTKIGVKVLDFGLAKSIRDETLTVTNAVMGTPAYMAPEQREGKTCDARADIYALGLVLLEMATGRRAAPGEPAQLDSLPEKLTHLVKACLAEDPDNRLQSVQDVKLELEWIRDTGPESAAPRVAATAHWRAGLPWALFAAALAFAVFAWLRGAGARSTAKVELVRFEIPLPKDLTRFTGTFALSPDGRSLAFAAAGSDGIPRIWIRDLDSLEMRPLAGTESVDALLAWSPDGRSIAFASLQKLLKVDISGGFAKALCNLERVVLSGAWSKDGVILFGGVGGPLMQVSADGGIPTPVTALDTAHGDVAHLNPYFLPDGRHFLYVRESNTSEDISVASLDAKPTEQDHRRLIEGGVIGPMYLSSSSSEPGQLLFVRGAALMAQRFDAGRLTLSGDPIRVLEAPVATRSDSCLCSVANNGTLVYRAPGNPQSQLTWFDEKGKPLATVGPPGLYEWLSLSPAGTQALVSKRETSSNASLWLIDTTRDDPGTPLTGDPSTGYGNGGAWSPDGRSMIFNVGRAGQMADLYQRPIDGAGDGAALFHSGRVKHALSWSRDGFLLFNVLGNGVELWSLPVKEPSNAVPLLQGGSNYQGAQFSPDGHWVAYASNESSRYEVYVKSFSAGRLGDGARVSVHGGVSPRWGQDGKLYYLGLDDRLMTLKLARESVVQTEAPTELFAAPHTRDWAPSPDGKRFLFLAPQQQQDTPLTVVLNWQAGPKK